MFYSTKYLAFSIVNQLDHNPTFHYNLTTASQLYLIDKRISSRAQYLEWWYAVRRVCVANLNPFGNVALIS